MPYQITNSDGSILTTVADNTVDTTTTSLALVGRNRPGYGQAIANNFVRLLQNSASYGVQPPNPIVGQLWFDTSKSPPLMSVYRGAAANPAWAPVSSGVTSILGLTGAVTLAQLTAAGAVAGNVSPAFTGIPTAPTANVNTSSNQVATCAFVLNQIQTAISTTGQVVSTVLGNTGSITLTQMVAAGLAPTGSPNFTGVPTAPTARVGTNTNQLATCSFVISQVGALSTGVSSVVGYTGNVTVAQLVGAGLAPISNAQLQGVCTAPTAALNTNTNQLATCAFVVAQLNTFQPTQQTIQTRQLRTGALTFYVSPAGSDVSGNGTQSSPFATMQHAFNVAQSGYDGGGNAFQIILMSGTHTSGLNVGPLYGFPDGVTVAAASVQGPPGSYQPANFIVSVTGGNCFNVYTGGKLRLRGMTLTASVVVNNIDLTTGGGHLVNCFGGSCTIDPGMVFGQADGIQLLAQASGYIVATSSYTISGSATSHVIAAESAVINILNNDGSMTVTLTSAPTFYSAFAQAFNGGYIAVIQVHFSGTCTGKQYYLANYGVINTSGAGSSYLPGSQPGVGSDTTGALGTGLIY